MVGRDDDIGGDEESAVLRRRDDVVSLVPYTLIPPVRIIYIEKDMKIDG